MVFKINDTDQLYSALNSSKRQVTAITSNANDFYFRKIKPKMKFGKYQVGENDSIRLRHLMPPVRSLKAIQGKISNFLHEIELPGCMHGAVKESNNIINALRHVENKFFLKIDLKDFFSRISNRQVHHVFLGNGFSWEVARILTKLTTNNGSLPQGAPSSPVLANLTFANAARELEKLIAGHNITFTIFLDDLVFSSKKDFKELIPQILHIIRSNRFFPHNKKIQYRRNFCEVTGLLVGNQKIKLIPEMQKEALHNSRIQGYAKSVERHYRKYLLTKTS